MGAHGGAGGLEADAAEVDDLASRWVGVVLPPHTSHDTAVDSAFGSASLADARVLALDRTVAGLGRFTCTSSLDALVAK